MVSVLITDEPKARTRRKTFNYVREGNTLRHISKYSISIKKVGDERAWRVIYEVPFERIKDKIIYRFSFSNSGSFFISKIRAEEFLKEKIEKEEGVYQEDIEQIEFEIEDQEVIKWINDFKSIYYRMISDVKSFKKKLDLHIFLPPICRNYFEDIKIGLLSSLCNWGEKSRLMSIKQSAKFIHQIWTLKVFHDAMGVKEIVGGVWNIEQACEWPSSRFIDENNFFWSCWVEAQKIQKAPTYYKGQISTAFGVKNIVWLRPDIVISKGKYESIKECPQFDILIECKNYPFEEWWKNGFVLENQLKPYSLIFDKDNKALKFLLSLHGVPDYAREKIMQAGFLVIDNFYPGSKSVQEFIKIVNEKIE